MISIDIKAACVCPGAVRSGRPDCQDAGNKGRGCLPRHPPAPHPHPTHPPLNLETGCSSVDVLVTARTCAVRRDSSFLDSSGLGRSTTQLTTETQREAPTRRTLVPCVSESSRGRREGDGEKVNFGRRGWVWKRNETILGFHLSGTGMPLAWTRTERSW